MAAFGRTRPFANDTERPKAIIRLFGAIGLIRLVQCAFTCPVSSLLLDRRHNDHALLSGAKTIKLLVAFLTDLAPPMRDNNVFSYWQRALNVNGVKYPAHLLIGNIVVYTKYHLLARRVAEIAKVEMVEGRKTSGMVAVEGLPIAWRAMSPSKQKGSL